jgi:hypothetical protein
MPVDRKVILPNLAKINVTDAFALTKQPNPISLRFGSAKRPLTTQEIAFLEEKVFGRGDGLIEKIRNTNNIDSRDNYGMTLLMHASNTNRYAPEFFNRKEHLQAMDMLLAAGADPNAQDDEGQTPLMHASWQGGAEEIRKLHAAGADVHATDKQGRTALLHAAKGVIHSNYEAIKALLDLGAGRDLSQLNRAMREIHGWGRDTGIHLLKEAGATADAPESPELGRGGGGEIEYHDHSWEGGRGSGTPDYLRPRRRR